MVREKIMLENESMHALRVEQMNSYGRLMASFSHEQKNHLGIIREANGLVSDLLIMHGSQLDEQLKKTLEKSLVTVEERVGRMAEAFHHLSGFAHRSDTRLSSFQPEQVVKEICQFLERFARLAQVRLHQADGGEVPAVYNDAALLHHVLFRLFLQGLEVQRPGSTMHVVSSASGPDASICFQWQDLAAPEAAIPESLIPAIERLNAACTVEQDASETAIQLILPSVER